MFTHQNPSSFGELPENSRLRVLGGFSENFSGDTQTTLAIHKSLCHIFCYWETDLGVLAPGLQQLPVSTEGRALISFDMYPGFHAALFGESTGVKPPLQNPAALQRLASIYISLQFTAVFHAFTVQLCRKLTPGATAQPHKPIYMQTPPQSHISVPFVLTWTCNQDDDDAPAAPSVKGSQHSSSRDTRSDQSSLKASSVFTTGLKHIFKKNWFPSFNIFIILHRKVKYVVCLKQSAECAHWLIWLID